MKSSIFPHVFNDISTYPYIFTEYFLHSFNLTIEFHVVLQNILRMRYFSCGSDIIKLKCVIWNRFPKPVTKILVDWEFGTVIWHKTITFQVVANKDKVLKV